MYTYMTKVISISDEAYGELKRMKNGFSFSGIILLLARTNKKNSIMDFAGKLESKEGENLKKEIMKERKLNSWRMR